MATYLPSVPNFEVPPGGIATYLPSVPNFEVQPSGMTTDIPSVPSFEVCASATRPNSADTTNSGISKMLSLLDFIVYGCIGLFGRTFDVRQPARLKGWRFQIVSI